MLCCARGSRRVSANSHFRGDGMLKRLELVGFKSFADKTQFDFTGGITAIVGPNGSGKSNIVDAVRWVLGEQSAKSLRGGEMTDVIFNGSASRRSLGLAEVTMTFDNRRRTLATDAEEVQIGRRVYRGGEAEYLINQQICRLKAKKIETLRKLERVDQNLQRLRDILEEVEKQLRSVKLQAAKAQRYQEYTDRLKRLRLDLGLQEYHQFTKKLDAEVQTIEHLRGDL